MYVWVCYEGYSGNDSLSLRPVLAGPAATSRTTTGSPDAAADAAVADGPAPREQPEPQPNTAAPTVNVGATAASTPATAAMIVSNSSMPSTSTSSSQRGEGSLSLSPSPLGDVPAPLTDSRSSTLMSDGLQSDSAGCVEPAAVLEPVTAAQWLSLGLLPEEADLQSQPTPL